MNGGSLRGKGKVKEKEKGNKIKEVLGKVMVERIREKDMGAVRDMVLEVKVTLEKSVRLRESQGE